MYLQVITVQEISGEDTRGCLGAQWGQRGRSLPPHSSHGEVQPIHAVQPLLLRCHVEGFHGRRGMVQDAGSAQHLTVEVINQRRQATRLHPQEGLTGGALEKVLQASTPSVAEVLLLFCGVGQKLRLH